MTLTHTHRCTHMQSTGIVREKYGINPIYADLEIGFAGFAEIANCAEQAHLYCCWNFAPKNGSLKSYLGPHSFDPSPTPHLFLKIDVLYLWGHFKIMII